MSEMITIEAKAEFLFELKSKQEWINRTPRILPDKTRPSETWVWIDKNGCAFELGSDFIAAEKNDTYPCKVYRLVNVEKYQKLLKLNPSSIPEVLKGIEEIKKL